MTKMTQSTVSGAAPLVEVQNLKVVARGEDGREFPIVKDVSFSVKRGEVVALIGESGSGKTTIALAMMGHARGGCRIAGGRVRLGDSEVTALSDCRPGRPARPPGRLHRAKRGRRLQPVAHHHDAGRRERPDPQDRHPRGGGDQGPRPVQGAGLARPRPGRRPLPASGVRRPASTAAGGDGAHHRSRTGDLRRADHRTGRHHADRGSEGLQGGGARPRHHRIVRLARLGGGDAGRRSHRRAPRRRHPRGRRDRSDHRCPARRLHPQPDRRRRTAAARDGAARRTPRCLCWR